MASSDTPREHPEPFPERGMREEQSEAVDTGHALPVAPRSESGPRRVEVEWIDSASWSSWRHVGWYVEKASVKEMLHRSCGYVLAENDDAIMLALSLTDEEDERDRMATEVMLIPRVAVLRVTEWRGRG